MKNKSLPMPDDRLEKIQSDLTTIKRLLGELVATTRRPITESEESILSVKQVAAFLGVEPASVYAKCAKGELPFFKIGKLYRFKKAEVMESIENPVGPSNVDDYVNTYLQKHVLRG